MDKTYDVLKEVTSVLPERIALIILSLPKEIKEDLQEIRLRINMPVTVSCNKHTYYLTDKSFTADLAPITRIFAHLYIKPYIL